MTSADAVVSRIERVRGRSCASDDRTPQGEVVASTTPGPLDEGQSVQPRGDASPSPGRVVELDGVNLTNRCESVIRGALGPSRQTGTEPIVGKYEFLIESQSLSKTRAVISGGP